MSEPFADRLAHGQVAAVAAGSSPRRSNKRLTSSRSGSMVEYTTSSRDGEGLPSDAWRPLTLRREVCCGNSWTPLGLYPGRNVASSWPSTSRRATRFATPGCQGGASRTLTRVI